MASKISSVIGSLLVNIGKMGGDSNSLSHNGLRKKKSNRTCRIEELEGREMLSVSPWLLAEDIAPIMEAGSATTWSDRIDSACDQVALAPLAAAPPENADTDDIAVLQREGLLLEDLTEREGVTLTWNAEGRLTQIVASDAGLTGSLDLTGLTALIRLNCGENQLTALDVSKCEALIGLSCYHNQLTELDVSENTALITLMCDFNQLAKLDVSGLAVLETLWCDFNQLTELNVSDCTALTRLSCSNNQLTALDVSSCTELEALRCDYNYLTSSTLELPSHTIEYFEFGTQYLGLNILITPFSNGIEISGSSELLASWGITAPTDLMLLYKTKGASTWINWQLWYPTIWSGGISIAIHYLVAETYEFKICKTDGTVLATVEGTALEGTPTTIPVNPAKVNYLVDKIGGNTTLNLYWDALSYREAAYIVACTSHPDVFVPTIVACFVGGGQNGEAWAGFTNVPSGTYTFSVTAINPNGVQAVGATTVTVSISGSTSGTATVTPGIVTDSGQIDKSLATIKGIKLDKKNSKPTLSTFTFTWTPTLTVFNQIYGATFDIYIPKTHTEAAKCIATATVNSEELADTVNGKPLIAVSGGCTITISQKGFNSKGHPVVEIKVTGLASGTKYSAQMQAFDGVKYSKITKYTMSTVKYAAVKGCSGKGTDFDAVTLKWNASKFAETKGYVVAVYADSMLVKTEIFANVPGKTKYEEKMNGLPKAGTKYKFVVYAHTGDDATNKNNWSSKVQKTISTAKIGMKTKFSGQRIGIDVFAGDITIQWGLTGIDMSRLSDIECTLTVTGTSQYKDYGGYQGKINKVYTYSFGTVGGSVTLQQDSPFNLYVTDGYDIDRFVGTVAHLGNDGICFITGLGEAFEGVNYGKVKTTVTITEIRAKVDGATTATTLWTGKYVAKDTYTVV